MLSPQNKPKMAKKNVSVLRRCMTMPEGSFAEPLLSTATTDMLSQKQRTCCPTQCRPHIAAAHTMGTNSLTIMDVSEGHWPWSHREPQVAPQPHDPEASVQNTTEGSAEPESSKKEIPFHLLAKANHQTKSDLNSAFNLRNQLGSLELCSRESICHRKDLPEGSTVLVKFKTPNRCSSSLRFQHFQTTTAEGLGKVK